MNSKPNIRAKWLILALLIGAFVPAFRSGAALAQQPPVPGATPVPIAAPAASPTPEATDVQKRREAFNIVWTTVKQFFFDPTFGGLDWDAVRQRYEPLVANAATDAEAHQRLQLMLNELHQSHFLIIPPDAIPQVLPDEEGEAGSPEKEKDPAGKKEAAKRLLKGNAELTRKLVNGIGIDVRVINNMVVISRVTPGSTAARAGLRPGLAIKKANGRSLDKIISDTLQSPLYHDIIRPELPLLLVAGYINGAPGTSVKLDFVDGRNRARSINIKRERLNGEMSAPVGNLPAMYGEIETRRLVNGIGYIRFNAFVPPLMGKLCHAIRSMSDAPGLILDLRGNQGGLLGMMNGVSGLLNSEPVALGALETRGGRSPMYAFPQALPYTGTLVILIDGSTESAAEMFAAGMKESKRAVVVGETSAGNTLPSTIRELPTGALFQYAFANYHTTGGALLEGHGVAPDTAVKLSRKALLAGHDSQLDAAIRKVKQSLAPPSGLVELIANASAIEPPKTDKPKVLITPVDAPPPAVRPLPGSEKTPTTAVSPTGKSSPMVDQVLEKYVEAAGGKDAFEKLHSRVTKGRAELSTMGLSGSLEVYEKAPNQLARLITVPGLGVMMRGNNEDSAWWQDSLQGYIELPRSPDVIRDGVFDKTAKIKLLYPEWEYKGDDKVAGRLVHVLQATTSPLSRYYFDAETGLLLRQGNTYFEDYREVDGVKLPFTIREDSLLGLSFVYKITEIKHNVPIDDAKFAPYPSCFTNSGR